MGIPHHHTCLLRNLYAGQEATVRTRHRTTDWFQIGKGVRQDCMLSPCLLNLHAECIMWNPGLDEAQTRIKIAMRNASNFRYADDLPCCSAGKQSSCNVGDLGSIPGLGRSPGGGKGYPRQYSGLENSMDCIVHGVTKSWVHWATFTDSIMQMTPPLWQEEESKSLLMKGKEESEKTGWTQHSKNEDHGIWSYHFKANMGKQWKQWQTLFWGASKSLQMVTEAMKLTDSCSLEENLWQT